MRTTVRLEEAILDTAKREAATRGTTLTSLIEQGLRLVMARPGDGSKRSRPRVKLPVCNAGGGVHPGVDLNNNAAVLDRIENY